MTDRAAPSGPRGGHAPELDVELPRRATVVIETVSAEIEVDGLVGDQRYRTTSGDLDLRTVSGRLVIETVSADLDIRRDGGGRHRGQDRVGRHRAARRDAPVACA